MNNKNQGFSLIILPVIVVVLVLGVVAFVLLSKKEYQPVSIPKMDSNAIQYASPTPTPASTAKPDTSLDAEFNQVVVESIDTDFKDLNASASTL